jgi:hypothetical protein
MSGVVSRHIPAEVARSAGGSVLRALVIDWVAFACCSTSLWPRYNCFTRVSAMEEVLAEGKACGDEKAYFKPSDKGSSHVEEGSSSHAEFMACAKDAAEEEGFMRHRDGTKRLVLSTTSSVYAEHTISNPDNDQVKYW